MSSNCAGSGEPGHQNGLNGQDNDSAGNSPQKKFTLSADAPVFVPRFAPPAQEPFFQSPVQPPVMLVEDEMPTQRELEEFERMISHPSSNSSGGTIYNTDNPIDMFKNAVITLSTKGNVDEYMKPIINKLKGGITDMAIINEIIDILYDHSVKEDNFSYTGAQICKNLSNELKNHHTFSNFRGLFLTKCKCAYDDRDTWVRDPALFSQLNNLAMLLGQLFLVIEVEQNGQLTKLGFLRQAISNLLMTFLAEPNDDRIKTAAQLLKLTGFEITKNNHLPGEFEEAYTIIKSLEKHPSLNRTSHCLINSVLSRLEYNWGVEQTS